MSEEFKGEVPKIEIIENTSGIFSFKCKKHDYPIRAPCRMCYDTFNDCINCLGKNRKFERLYVEKAKCITCGFRLNYGYFMLIYLLEKAGLLPGKFKMLCCICRSKEEREKNDLPEN